MLENKGAEIDDEQMMMMHLAVEYEHLCSFLEPFLPSLPSVSLMDDFGPSASSKER